MEVVVVGILGPGSSLVIEEVNHLRFALCFLSYLVSGESSLDAEPGLYLGLLCDIFKVNDVRNCGFSASPEFCSICVPLFVFFKEKY